MDRKRVLQTAAKVITEDRVDIHGNAEDSFKDIAKLWTAYTGIDFTGFDVAVMMSLFKIGRMKQNFMHEDNYIDACGYIALAAEYIPTFEKEKEHD